MVINMALTSKFMKLQLNLIKPLINGCTLETARATQDKIGQIVAQTQKKKLRYSTHVFKNFMSVWVIPKKQKIDGVILYLHGGGYVAGDVEYVKSFGSTLANKNNIRVFCPAYRLAPEHPFPAAVEDCLEAYLYLLSCGYTEKNILLCGESAGGALLYSLCLKLQEMGMELPCGIISISPWVDLTFSTKSLVTNKDNDPALTKERLEYYAECYTTEERKNPLVSPIFGELKNMPPSLIFVGGGEILLDEAKLLHKRLEEFGNKSELIITPDMWHAYILYGIKETKNDHVRISEFIGRNIR